MNWIADMQIEVRLAILFLLGVAVGGQLNRAIYRLAWNPRDIGPWSPPASGVPPRHWSDRLPLVGWWNLRREAPRHGRLYWLRPLLIELAAGLGLAGLYWVEVHQQALWPALPGVGRIDPSILHAQFASHALLTALMIVATFIDFDEQTIPDEVTVTGAVAGLLLAIALPSAGLPTLFDFGQGPISVHHVVVTSSSTAADWQDGLGGPNTWPQMLSAGTGWVIAVAGIWAWCFAILHKTWTLRRGVFKAFQYMVVSIRRRHTWRVPLAIGLALTAAASLTWLTGTARWESLMSAIVGMCFGGGLIWAVRIVGGQALRMEAMGFGDVTLMAMIGAFLGWQACFLIFFLAPFTALFVATAQRLLTGQQHIAFGPYLCFATLIVIVGWDAIWTGWANPMFSLGWFIPLLLACCLMLMGALLWIWRLVRDALFY